MARLLRRRSSSEVPCGCFVHFADIQMNGYRELRAGRRVQFTFGRPGALPDGCAYRALRSGQAADGDAQAPIAADDDVTQRGLAS